MRDPVPGIHPNGAEREEGFVERDPGVLKVLQSAGENVSGQDDMNAGRPEAEECGEKFERIFRIEHRIFAGNVGNDASTLAQSLGLTITDYFASEELSVRNAIPTAEGAIEAAMKHTSVTLHGTPCLVLGFGRIGKVLAHDLSALGAKVSVSARKRSDLAWIDAFGYAPLHTNRLSGTLGEFRVVFNTVPHQVLDEALLAELPPDCLLIELASASGFDMDAVETLRLSYLKAGGLPGRVAPETAARAIKKTLCRLIKEEA